MYMYIYIYIYTYTYGRAEARGAKRREGGPARAFAGCARARLRVTKAWRERAGTREARCFASERVT